MISTLIDFAAIEDLPGDGKSSSMRSLDCIGSPALKVAFGSPKEVLIARTLDQVRPVIQAVQQRALQGQWCAGYVAYEAAPAWDRALEVHDTTRPLAWFGVHDAPLPGFSDLEPSATPNMAGIAPGQQAAASQRVLWQSGLERAVFDAALARLKHAIVSGEIYQANFTAQSIGQLAVSALELYAALREAQPGGFAAYVDTGDEKLLSVSPELFFDWHQGRIVTRPMKGTAPRGRTQEEDAAFARTLSLSPKERAENVMIVDLIRNDLSKLATPFSVTVANLFHVQALPTVWQMVTEVRAHTRPGTTLDEVFAALFPCGSVTGAPKVQAMRLIRELETATRGAYCGAIGVVRPGGSATFNVPIRTLVVHADRVQAGTGSGITADSKAPDEWTEWKHKQAYLVRANQRFELLETLGLCDGVLPHGPAHIARMAAAAAHFGFQWQAGQVQHALDNLLRTHAKGRWRVRMQLDREGNLQIQTDPLHSTPGPLRLQLAPNALHQAHSEFVRHKTTRRAHYDAFAPTDPQVFDTVLWNSEGEVTECTRGNLALLINDRWVTPAIHCGLLPGIGRAHWLSEGRIEEAVVRVSDLPQVQALAFINSLRGWVDAIWHVALPDQLTGKQGGTCEDDVVFPC